MSEDKLKEKWYGSMSNKRFEGESFEDYKQRRKETNSVLKRYLNRK
jgi:hypothetical protein